MIRDNSYRGRAERLLNIRLDVSTRVLKKKNKRKPERFALSRHNEGGRMRDRIYTPRALYVARADTAGTKRKTPLMEIGRMQNIVWDFTGSLKARLTHSCTPNTSGLVYGKRESIIITVG